MKTQQAVLSQATVTAAYRNENGALRAENARLREQNKALADALDTALFFAGERTAKFAQTRLSTCDTVLRAYREAVRHESEAKE